MSNHFIKNYRRLEKCFGSEQICSSNTLDLSNAFDCLPDDLLLLKLKFYGAAPSSLNLLESYLNNRKQCVKVGTHSSNWQTMFKGYRNDQFWALSYLNLFK